MHTDQFSKTISFLVFFWGGGIQETLKHANKRVWRILPEKNISITLRHSANGSECTLKQIKSV